MSTKNVASVLTARIRANNSSVFVRVASIQVQRRRRAGPAASAELPSCKQRPARSAPCKMGLIGRVMLERAKSSGLGQGAKALRTGHALIAVVGLSSVAYIWTCAIRRRRDRVLRAALVALSVQGIAIVVGRGNCPLGPLQEQFEIGRAHV
jgi:hypothetical protein